MKKIIMFIILSVLFCGCTKETAGEVSNNESSAVTETIETSTTEESTTEAPTTETPTTEAPTTEVPTTEEPTTEIQISDDELNLMQRALLGKVDIYDTEDGKYKKISEIPDYCEQMDFIYADFDDDGINEVVVRFPMEASVFHKVDEVVYRYPMSLRVKYNEDGTINGSSGANFNYLFKIRFTEKEIVDEFIYYAIEGKVYKVYEYDGEQIEYTEEEWEEIKEKYPEIMIDSYEFNHNNVVTLITN